MSRTARLIEIADQVVALLNALEPTPAAPVDAARRYIPFTRAKECAERKVTVMPAGRARERANRAEEAKTFTIHIGVQQQIESPEDAEQIDGLMAFIEALDDALHDQHFTLPDGAEVYWESSENDPAYHPQGLFVDGLFTSVLQTTWEVRE